MDSETGEALRDKETGEMPSSAQVNLETGETEINSTAPDKQTHRKFRIPSSPSKEETNINDNKYFITSDIVPCLIFLFSATLFLNPIVFGCLGVLEVCLHLWAHKKNKKLKMKN